MSIREIKKHIRTTKEIARITNGMYLLATSRISKVRKRREQAGRYFKEVLLLASIAHANVKKKDISLLTQRPTRTLLYVVVTPEQGFCGGLPSSINRWATTCAEEQQTRMAHKADGKLPTIRYLTVGKKGRDYIIRSKRNLAKAFTNTEPTWALAMEITQIIVEAFHNGEVDAAFIVYAQADLEAPKPVVEQLLPVSLSRLHLSATLKQEPVEVATEIKRRSDAYVFYSPDLESIFPGLVLRSLISRIYWALLEGALSEHTARMVAMKQAAKKAKEALDDLTLAYNVARQAQITSDLLEITAAAEALQQQQLFP
jgi:F-type H+-transporting ATPase subunit gamma